MSSGPVPPSSIDPIRPRLDPEPTHRPEPRFWPYLDLAEQPSEEELAALDPDLRLALSRTGVGGQGGWGAFSLTLAFPRFEGPDFERAVAMARASRQYLETGSGAEFRIRARFQPDDVPALRDLYQLVGDRPGLADWIGFALVLGGGPSSRCRSVGGADAAAFVQSASSG